MPYWNDELHGNDFAFDSVSAVIFQIVEQLDREAELVVESRHPEQSILALLRALELLMDEFPKCVAVHFRKRHYLSAKQKFLLWQTSLSLKNDANVQATIISAEALFERLDRKFKIDQ